MQRTNMQRTNKPLSAHHPKQIAVTEIAILQLFSTSSFLSVNKSLLQKFGPEPAIWLSFMIDRFLYLKQGEKIKDNWFYFIHARQCEQMGISEYGIKKCKSMFSDLGIIQTKYGGLPKKEWYSINTNKLAEVMGIAGQDPTISRGQEGMGSGGHYKSINRLNKETKERKPNISNNKNSLLDVPNSSYDIDSFEQWEEGSPINYKSFVSYFNETTGARCRMTQSKKDDIKKQLKVFTGHEIKQALKARSISLKDSEYLPSWESIFTRKTERMEKYLNMNISKAGRSNDQAKPNLGYKSKNIKYDDGEIIQT